MATEPHQTSYPVSTLKIADLEGDGRQEVVLGLENPGAVYILSRRPDGWWESADTAYLWSTVTSLEVLSTPLSPFKYVAAAGSNGKITLFTWTGTALQPVGEDNRYAGRTVRFLGAGDLDGDGWWELALTVDHSRLVILRYDGQSLYLAAENFPWGDITGGAVADVNGDGRAEVVVGTIQRLIYAFSWQVEGLEQLWRLSNLAAPPHQLSVIELSPERRWLLAEVRDALAGWQVDLTGRVLTAYTGERLPVLRSLWTLPSGSAVAPGPASARPAVEFSLADGTVVRYDFREKEELALEWKDGAALGREQWKELDGEVHLSLSALAEHLNGTVTRSELFPVLTLVTAGHTLALSPENPGAVVDGQPVPTVSWPKARDNQAWLPLSYLEAVLGLTAYRDPLTGRLLLDLPWARENGKVVAP